MRYYIKEDGEGPEDAQELTKENLRYAGRGVDDFAEAVAQHYFDNRDGGKVRGR